MPGQLYLVSLPIGNLEDITIRAIRTLRSADAIVAEDTRTTRRVLDRYAIRTTFFSSIYQGAERGRIELILDQLRDGKNLALVSDAGTPLISDPGFPLVRAAIDAGITVSPIPGPSALLAGLVGSGLPPDRFSFGGSLPRKVGDRRARIAELEPEEQTTVFYESPHRLQETLAIIDELLPDRPMVLARELTKLHETFVRGTAGNLVKAIGAVDRVRGECVLLIGGASEPQEANLAPQAIKILALLKDTSLPKRTLVDLLVIALGMKPNEAYRFVHEQGATDDAA
ncbi:16S rRNA (cytidine(1402)-2'-O)-methyltransferase [Candidatus Bipolaricaulota bacterium]|nr:16S rRNA (cytidine(1402)-2'-O)-methyltransferase [Candidatus Bipolaricaulota bacterium]